MGTKCLTSQSWQGMSGGGAPVLSQQEERFLPGTQILGKKEDIDFLFSLIQLIYLFAVKSCEY